MQKSSLDEVFLEKFDTGDEGYNTGGEGLPSTLVSIFKKVRSVTYISCFYFNKPKPKDVMLKKMKAF